MCVRVRTQSAQLSLCRPVKTLNPALVLPETVPLVRSKALLGPQSLHLLMCLRLCVPSLLSV